MPELFHSTILGSMLSATLGTGTISCPLTLARTISGGTYPNTAGVGGFLTSNSTPPIAVVSGATRVTWATGSVVALAWNMQAPVDFDPTQALTVNVIASMGGASDTPVLTVNFIEAIGGSNVGGTTTALSATPTVKTVTVAADALAGGNQWQLMITPGTHGTDTLLMDTVWIEYKRR